MLILIVFIGIIIFIFFRGIFLQKRKERLIFLYKTLLRNWDLCSSQKNCKGLCKRIHNLHSLELITVKNYLILDEHFSKQRPNINRHSAFCTTSDYFPFWWDRSNQQIRKEFIEYLIKELEK